MDNSRDNRSKALFEEAVKYPLGSTVRREPAAR